MAKRSRKKQSESHRVAIEICRSHLQLTAITQPTEGTTSVHTRRIEWRREAVSLLSQKGGDELAEAMKELVQNENFASMTVTLALSGDYCVTRSVSGSSDHVRRELSELERRSALYLSLGHGAKSLGGSIRQLDARHQHALLGVVNQKILDTLIDAGNRAGLNIDSIEPSMVSLCRLIGMIKRDDDLPAVVVSISEQGAEVGITHQGQLLLDYRPAGNETNRQIADVVAQHMSRLQRYCDRYLTFAKGKIQRVFICGDSDSTHDVCSALKEQSDLTIEVLNPSLLDDRWQFDEATDSNAMAALGTCYRVDFDDRGSAGPNLMQHMSSHAHQPLVPTLLRTFWPVAAALLVGMGAWIFVAQHQRTNDLLAQQLAPIEEQSQESRRIRGEALMHRVAIEQLKAVSSGLSDPSWHTLLTKIAGCLPEDVWLTDFQVDSQGNIALTGTSYTSDGVFEFHRWLEQFTEFRDVALISTRPTRARSGPALRFEIHCVLREFSDLVRSNDGTT